MSPTKKAAPRGSAKPAPKAIAGLPLGKTGGRHPAIGLGLWAQGRWNPEFEARTKATVAHAIERGVEWFDTAEVYGGGRSERLLGDLLDRRGRDAPPLFVTTKLSWEHLRPAQIRSSLQGSLQRLGRPSVDVYLVHAPDPHVPIAATMGALETLWKEGKFRAIGVSNFSLEQLEAAVGALGDAPLVVNQVLYNLLDREDGDPLVDYCRKHSIVLEAYTPLGRGLLAGRFLTKEKPSVEVLRYAHRLAETDRFPVLLERARALNALAKAEGVPLASLALHWLAGRGCAPLFGASRPEQVDGLLKAWSQRPSDALLHRAEGIAQGNDA
ncbi:MAG: aldo/keto reductase [Thermoplasmata archaeon]|nr:aldo/keto reductase [Thermoplasmata archaeon]